MQGNTNHSLQPDETPTVRLSCTNASSQIYGGPSAKGRRHQQAFTNGLNQNVPFRNTPSVNSTTSNRTPPPGASLSTLGTKPLYRAFGPSSRKMVISLYGNPVTTMPRDIGRKEAYAGYVQLYFGITPGNFSAPWMRDLTTCIMV